MHPRERRSTRRHFLFASAGRHRGSLGCRCPAPRRRRARRLVRAPVGPGGIPLARRNHPVTLPIYSDNEPIASGKNTEKGR